MLTSLETRFTNFLEHTAGAESIDALHTPGPNDPEMADYYLAGRKIVAEIKSLDADQMCKGSDVLDEHLSNKGAVIFGTLPSSRFTDSPEEEAALKQKIQDKMTVRIKKICSKANGQIGRQFEELPHLATGVLILINENNISMHPSMVADRVVNYAAAQPRNFHYCLLVFESHKISVNGRLLPYPLLLDLTRSARQRRAALLLQSIQWQWAKTYGHTKKVVSNENKPLAYYPEVLTFGA
jgi:hypothetical protein